MAAQYVQIGERFRQGHTCAQCGHDLLGRASEATVRLLVGRVRLGVSYSRRYTCPECGCKRSRRVAFLVPADYAGR